MKLNFKQIKVEVTFDEFKELDITKHVGNYIHTNTNDIGLDDVAREIYHSTGEIEVPDEYIPKIKELIESPECQLLAGVKRAILKQFDKE